MMGSHNVPSALVNVKRCRDTLAQLKDTGQRESEKPTAAHSKLVMTLLFSVPLGVLVVFICFVLRCVC